MRTTREYLQALLDGKWLRDGRRLIKMGDDKMYIKDDHPWRPYYGCPCSGWEIIDPIPEPPKPVSFMEALRGACSGETFRRCDRDGLEYVFTSKNGGESGLISGVGKPYWITSDDFDAKWIKVEDAK